MPPLHIRDEDWVFEALRKAFETETGLNVGALAIRYSEPFHPEDFETRVAIAKGRFLSQFAGVEFEIDEDDQ
jgi:hypothetical protein